MTTDHGIYTPELLLRMFRKAAALRKEMLAQGFTDNGGAIHSASRILDILCNRLRYPGLSHINNYRHHAAAEFTEAAWEVYCAGGKVMLEHVAPLRALTIEAIRLVDGGATDEELSSYLKGTYRLVLMTAEETRDLNRRNRSRIDPERLSAFRVIVRPEQR